MELRTEIRERLSRSRNCAETIAELERETETIADGAARASALIELAAAAEELLPEREVALAMYQRAWKVSPEATGALARARAIYHEIGRPEMVARLGELQLRDMEGQPEAATLAGIVGVALIDCGERERALPFLQFAIANAPDSAASPFKDALAAAQYDSDDWRDVVERLIAGAESADTVTAARMLLRAARIYRFEDAGAAEYESLLARILKNDPQNESAHFLLTLLLSEAERWQELEDHHERRAYAMPEEARADLYRRFALEWSERIGDRDRGARFFSRALDAWTQDGQAPLPSLVAGFAMCREAALARGDAAEFLALADAALPRLAADARLFVALHAGLAAWQIAGDQERARMYFDIAREGAPENPDLQNFYANHGGDHDRVAAADPPFAREDAVEPTAEGKKGKRRKRRKTTQSPPIAEGAASSSTEAEAASHNGAQEPEEEIDDAVRQAMDAAREAEGQGTDRAVDAWRKAIAMAPDKRGPRRGLARVLREAERWNPLADALKEEEQKACPTPASQIEVLREMVEVYRALRHDHMIATLLGRILEIDEANIEVIDTLAAQYESMKRWPDLVATLKRKAEHLEDPAKVVALHLQIANLYIDKFSNQAEAIRAFEKVLELNPDNAEATEHLLAVYEKRRDWEKLIRLRERDIAATEDPLEKADKVYEVAKLAATRLKKPDICTEWWERVLAGDPAHEEALAELEKLYERGKDWDRLAEVCAKKAAIAADEKTQVESLQKLGLLYTDKVADDAKAIEAWRNLLDIQPDHRRAQDALKKLYISANAWDQLEVFYRERDKLDELVRVLERQVDTSAQAGQKDEALALAMKVAAIYQGEVGKPDRAMRAYEKALSIDEENLAAAEALIPLYESGRDPRKLTRVLEIQLAKTADDGLRLQRVRNLAEYSEQRLRDKGAALGWWLKAHAEDPADESIRAEIERLAEEAGGWPEVVDAYRASYDKLPSRADALPLFLVVARVQESELADIDAAIATNRAILEVDADNAVALDALERLYLGKVAFEDLLGVYSKKLELAEGSAARADIQRKIGQLYEDEVKSDDDAIAAYQGILDESGEDLPALRALDRIYARTEKWPELADILIRELAVLSAAGGDDSEHTGLLFSLGQIREQHLADPAGAIDAYREIMATEPGHAGARASLERYLQDEDRKRAAADILEPVYEQLDVWPSLVGVHEIQLATERDRGRRVALLMRIGDLCATRLGDAERAFDAYARALAEDASEAGARDKLEELGGLLDDGFVRLVGLYESALAEQDLSPALAHELCIKAAQIFEDRLAATDKAIACYRRALQHEPDDRDALDALERIFARDERYPELLEIHRRKADIAEPENRLSILFRIASIHEEMLNSPEDAIASYNEIIGHDPDNISALRALDGLYTRGSMWRDLGDNLTRQLSLAGDEVSGHRVSLLCRLAQLRETHLGELGAAVETYREVLELDGGNEVAVTALERLITSEEHELSIAQILEPIYRATGQIEKQVEIAEIMARHAFDPERKIELLHQVAELYEVGGDNGEAAFAAYARALREEPRNELSQRQLERLARSLDKYRDLVALYDEVAGSVSDEELKIQLLTKVAQVHELELLEDASAVATYERILEVAPGHVESASAIITIHERTGDYPALVAALQRKAEILLDVSEQKQLLYRAAQIQEEVLEDTDAAIATYRSVLALDDIDVPAMDALERLYIRLERWEPLKDVYGKKADLAEDPDDKKRMLYVLGQVHDRELGDVGRAIETYQAILDIDPDELPAIQALDRLHGKAGRWYDLLQNLERQVDLAETTGEAVGLKYRIGRLWQTELQDLSRAIDTYREALELDPAHYETMLALDELCHKPDGEPVMAACVLEPIYEASGETEKLIDVLEVMAAHAEDPLARVELLHRIASLNEARQDRPRAAFDALARALREDNSNELSLGHLERLAQVTGAWPDLAELYAAEADKSLDVPRQVDLLSRLARVHEEELAHTENAIAIYRRILDVEFDNRGAIYALDRLLTGAERWAELAEVLRKEIQIAESDEEVAGLQFRLGQVLEQNLRDLPAAIEVYREILTADPEHVPTLSALEMMFLEGNHELEIAAILEPIYQNAGELEKLHKIYEVQLSKLEQPGERQVMHQRLAELCEERLFDPGRALAWWGRALIEDPRSEMVIDEVARLARATGAWQDVVALESRVLEVHGQSDIRRQSLLRMARVFNDELSDPVRAVECYLQVLEIDPNEPDALAALDVLYEGAGMFDELVEILRRRIEVTLDGDELCTMQLRRGRIFAEALGDLDAALACYAQVLEQESRNRDALEAQERIFFSREDWQSLYGVYEKLIDIADGDAELGDVYARMARIASDALADEEGAIELLGNVLAIRGEDAEALSALADLYSRRQMWTELTEVLERAVTVADDDGLRVALYKRLGTVWADRLNRERNALDAWLRAYEIAPDDLQTLRALAHLYRATQSWEELSQTLSRVAEVGQLSGGVSEDEMINLYAQLGQLEGDILGRVNEAVDAWRRVLALDPQSFAALAALETLFSREARWEECIEVLERRATVLEDDTQRIDTLLQAGAIWEEKVEDHDQAAAVYERVRQVDPANTIASGRLEAIYRGQYKWEQLNEVLLERVEHTTEQEDRIRTLQQVARIYEQELGDQESAFWVLQAAFRENYAHEETARELERLATAASKWEELLADYSQMVQSLEGESPDDAADLWVKIGRWYGDHLQHIDWAIHSVQQALRINPDHLGALSALAGFQRKRGSWSELVEVLGRHAAIEPDTGRKVGLYLQLAELFETQLQDPMQAMAAYQSALAADPTCTDALSALDRLYRAHQMWEQLIDVLGRMAELHSDPDEVTRIKLEVGQLWDDHMGDASRAIATFKEVVDIEPGNLPALRALEHLYEKTGQSEAYLDNLEAQLDASPTDAEQISLYERMSSAWEERFGKLDRAAECLEKIVALDERSYVSYEELERLYRQQQKWDSLVDTYRRHIAAITDSRTRIDLHCAMGDIYERELQDYDRAIEAYADVLAFDPNEPRALDALGRLYERIQEWGRAIDAMSQLVGQTQDPAMQVDLHHRIGRILAAKLDNPEDAESRFLHVLTVDAGHVPSMEALVSLYSERGDWLKAAQMMVRAESVTANVLDKQRLLYDAATIYLDRLGDKQQAKGYYAAVLALNPEHVEAAEPLATLYFEGGEWPELSPVLDMLVRKASQKPGRAPRELGDLYFRTAKCADELGDNDKALKFYKAAYDIDSTHLPTLIGRADLLYKMRNWEGAGKIYQTILVQHRDSQAAGDVVRTYFRLGMVRQNLGERKKALNMFEKALEIDPHHTDTLHAVIDIQAAQGDWESVIHAKRGLMSTAPAAGQAGILDEIGDIYHKQLRNPQKAISTFLEAVEIRPDDHQLLQKVLDLYTETEQWKKAVEIIERFASLENDAIRRGSYYQAAGTICRDKIKAIDEAIDFYNRALDNFFENPERLPQSMRPRALKAFADIDKILTAKRDWKSQERAYRQMIKRLPPGDRILVDLWHSLGEIYRSRLRQFQSAVAAYEIAQKLDPTNKSRREILAELYLLSGPDQAEKAVQQHMEMLKLEPFKLDSYKALRKIYMDTHQYDKTWCVCNALAVLKKADPEEQQFYEQYKPRGFVKAKQRMTEDVWRRIYHPDENPFVSAIFGAIWQGPAMLRAYTHKQLDLKRKDRRQIETDQLQFSKIFYYVTQVLGVPVPDVYLQPEQAGDIAVANTQDRGQIIPSFVVRASLLSNRPEKEIAFACARWLTFMRPEHYLKLTLTTNTELKTAFLSAIVLIRRDFPIPADMKNLVAQYLPEMQKRIRPEWLEPLGQVVNRFLQNAPEINLAKWGNAVDATSHRVGFVLCGDLQVATQMVANEQAVVGGPQVKDKVKELILYSISEDYFAVRDALETKIG